MSSIKKIFFTIVLFFSVSISLQAQSNRETAEIEFQKFGGILDIIDNYYVDSVNTAELIDKAIIATLENLDPHSVYIPKKEVDATNEPLVGNFEGVGIQFNILSDTIIIANVIPGGPSERVGLLPGDKIILVNDTLISGVKIANSGVMGKLRGPKNTKVKVSVLRKGEKKLLDFTITRDKIPLYSVDASYMIDNKIGYIKLSKFSATTVEEVHNAIAKLQAKGMIELILDLQDNGGGYLNAAVGVADEFLDKDKLIVYTEGLHQPRQTFTGGNKGLFENGNLVVLINENSASASEIVSGALQDWDRALVVGRNSFGKGLVQKPFPLMDGSQVRLTIAEYFTPTGRCIQRPYDKGKRDYYSEFEKRYTSGRLMYMDSIKLPDSLRYTTLTTKRNVYGCGGILPDIFVGIDTLETSEYFSNLVRKGVFNTFVLKYLDNNRKTILEKYPNIQTYKTNFEVDKTLIDMLIKAGEEDSVKYDAVQYKKSERIIKTNLKALIARSVYDAGDFYYIINDLNNSYAKALKVLQEDKIKNFKILHF